MLQLVLLYLPRRQPEVFASLLPPFMEEYAEPWVATSELKDCCDVLSSFVAFRFVETELCFFGPSVMMPQKDVIEFKPL